MSRGARPAVAGTVGLLIVFGAFLLFWAQHRPRFSEDGKFSRFRASDWLIPAAGVVTLAACLLLPTAPPPSVPKFLKRQGDGCALATDGG